MEAERSAGVVTAQDMMYIYCLILSVQCKVALPMVLEMDNKGALDLANSMSVGGRTQHVDVREHFLHELKEDGLLLIKWIDGDDNDADIFTKNTSAAVFNRHFPLYVSEDKYMDTQS